MGTEILLGQIDNTNSVFLSRELSLLGIDVLHHFTVGDNDLRLRRVLDMAYEDSDLVITTGGLGPTEDDLTKETIAAYFDEELVAHAGSLAALEHIAELRGRAMTPNNYKQALMPSGAEIFDNPRGSAPGFALTKDGRTIISMPGPPYEMEPMWRDHARPYLESQTRGVIYYRMLRMFGIGESALETALLPLIDAQTDPTLATYAKSGECSVRIASKRPTLAEARAAVDEMAEKVRGIAGEYIYSFDGEEYSEAVGRRLIAGGISIAACESCTGGMFSQKLIGVPGISAVFDRGLVTYTEKAKIEELGVSPRTIEEHTAESPELALEMARGLRQKTGCRLAVSSTGVAGPGGYHGHEAGTMYAGICFDDIEEVREMHTHRDDRDWNRNFCCLNMFDLIFKAIKSN